MTFAKKTWDKPVMTVLVRSNPEEAVLQGCKGTDIIGAYGGNAFCRNPSGNECDSVATT